MLSPPQPTSALTQRAGRFLSSSLYLPVCSVLGSIKAVFLGLTCAPARNSYQEFSVYKQYKPFLWPLSQILILSLPGLVGVRQSFLNISGSSWVKGLCETLFGRWQEQVRGSVTGLRAVRPCALAVSGVILISRFSRSGLDSADGSPFLLSLLSWSTLKRHERPLLYLSSSVSWNLPG